ncbi:P-loop containing nucleoside triphosphate hydrolase protein [Anaeromyces robustus]|uniref:p-loop containing nucleoside triphosphate hydrolase protein n=1 Tax=Anaeromyces robustus TaxID=1754192 RepID=A0A1Y1WBU8_9FUNG|nr:P-loop containing nucleoside triphosphate hydrolase protein [Anaeromyces robustus]|eukprot:ORX71007.1 P-loop containing nucleoside triphosphate hydrolase protein [Anaeromyces robustus]
MDWDLYTSQVRSLIEKNIKKKKIGHFKIYLSFQILIPLAILAFIGILPIRKYEYDVEPSVVPKELNEYNLYSRSGTLVFVVPPDSNKNGTRDNLINNLKSNKAFKFNPFLRIELFDDLKTFESFNMELPTDNDYVKQRIIATIIFNNNYSDYTIRITEGNGVEPYLEPVENYYETREGILSKDYYKPISESYLRIFSPLQAIVNQAIIQTKTNKTIDIDFKVGKLGKPKITLASASDKESNKNLTTKSLLYPIILFLQCLNIMNGIMDEKAKGQESGLIVMGVYPSAIRLSWEITYLPIILFASIVSVLIEMRDLYRFITLIFPFFYIFIYGLSIYAFVIILTKIFRNKKIAIICLFIIHFVLYMDGQYIYLLENNYPILLKLLCILISPINLTIGLTKIVENSYNGNYISFNNFFKSGFGIYFILLICSVILYHLISDCVEYFSFKFHNLFKRKCDFTQSRTYKDDIEEDPSDCGKPFVEVKDIFKVYKQRGNNKFLNLFYHKNVNVLKGISFKVYKNETFGILGHNGAGKSTLIKIMTGLLKADNGNVYYKGLELTSNLNKIRKRIGICLQDTIAFDELTVEDNLYIFAGLRNTYVNIEDILEDIDLEEKRYSRVGDLSGGQKRKLCIGLSLIGNPRFIFLDEPTTSLDPLSRRKIWEILMKIKNNRVIFLCTHYMDEADILCDRKMIINDGIIRCSGTSVYLKNHFNMKYLLNVETKNKYKNEINDVILRHIPEASYIDIINQENDLYSNNNNSKHYLTYNNENIEQVNYYTWALPMSLTNKYYNLLCELESLKGKTLNKVSLDSPYFEDLFVKITSENFEKKAINNENNLSSDFQKTTKLEVDKIPKFKKVKELSNFRKTLRFIRYRFMLFLRNRTFILVYLLPFLVLGLIFYSLKDEFNKDKMVRYQGEKDIGLPEMYNGYQWNYDINNSNIKDNFTGELIDNVVSNININNHGKNQIKLSYNSTSEMEEIIKQGPNPSYISSFNVNFTDNSYLFEIYSNESMVHSVPVTINTLSNTLLSLNGINETITTRSHPYDYKPFLSVTGIESITMMIILICVSVVISFFGPIAIRERNEKLLKQLYLNGITNKIYWLSMFITSFILLYALLLGIIGLFAWIGLEFFRNTKVVTILVMVLPISCLSSILFQYFISLFLDNESLSYIIYIIINILPPFVHLTEGVDQDRSAQIFHDVSYSLFGSIMGVVTSTFYPAMNISKSIFQLLKIHSNNDGKISYSILLKNDNGNGMLFLLISSTASIFVYLAFFIYGNKQVFKEKINHIYVRTKKDLEKLMKRLKQLDEDVLIEYKRVTDMPIPKEEKIQISIPKDSKIIHQENENENENSSSENENENENSSSENENENENSSSENDDDSKKSIVKKEFINENDKDKLNQIPIRVINVGKEYTVFKHINKDLENVLDLASNPNPKYGEYHYSDYDFAGPVVTSLKDVTLGINYRESFGLLGPNGSGKSSLLNIITYNNTQSAGKIYYDDIENTSIKEDHFMIGYCPQNDNLWPELTLFEHLVMYINLRGYSLKESREYAEKYIEYCKIELHKNKYPHELSGGTKRKLCVLIALISFTNKILLDEPSSGMDPATRRYIWNVITSYKNNEDSSIVLTTHAMEEAELLCDRIGILINGELLAIGSPTHLKMKFGDTYTLELQSPDVKLVNEMIRKDIPLIDQKDTVTEFKSNKRIRYTFKITNNHGEIFKVMENYKDINLVNDYSFTQITLEDIFLRFAKLQDNQEM